MLPCVESCVWNHSQWAHNSVTCHFWTGCQIVCDKYVFSASFHRCENPPTCSVNDRASSVPYTSAVSLWNMCKMNGIFNHKYFLSNISSFSYSKCLTPCVDLCTMCFGYANRRAVTDLSVNNSAPTLFPLHTWAATIKEFIFSDKPCDLVAIWLLTLRVSLPRHKKWSTDI